MHAYTGVARSPGIHLGFGFFFNGGHDHFDAMSARCFQQQKRKSAVAGDQT
jgi:hypothetical protein